MVGRLSDRFLRGKGVSKMTVSEKTSMDKLVDDLLQNYLQRIRGVRYEIDAMEKSIKALLESRK